MRLSRPLTIIALPAITGLAIAIGAAGSAQAYSVGRHANYQQARINNGVRSGRLTSREDSNLQRRENSIRDAAQSDRAANGGTLTRNEKVRLGARQAALSGSIYADKHNAATTTPAAPAAAPPH